MEFFIALVSLGIGATFLACAIVATLALRKIAAEAAATRRLVRFIAETQLARGENELAEIKIANGIGDQAQLCDMPGGGESNADRRNRKISSILNS